MNSGDTIGRYRLVDQLGRGGMGEVWLATATGYGGFTKNVVLKTLLAEYEQDPLFIEMLAHEARTCGKLSHPNLIEVFDFSKHGSRYLLAMEHVHGEPLSQIMRVAYSRGVPIPPAFALRVLWECCLGLEFAHSKGVIHCDLSPSNVMVTYRGVSKVLDFGVSHSSKDKPDRLKGKLSYMAPERIRSLATDRRTDVYSLGVMLFLLCCGRLPFNASSDAELLRLKLTPPPRPSDFGPIDPAIEGIILRAIDPDPEARFQSAAELQTAVGRCLEAMRAGVPYAQLEVAAYMNALFDVARLARGSEPPVREKSSPPPPPARREAIATVKMPTLKVDESWSRIATRRGGAPYDDDELAMLDIEVVSSVVEPPLVQMRQLDEMTPDPLAVPLEAPQPQLRLARASSTLEPLVQPLFVALGLGPERPPPVDEQRTSVQSLFGETRLPARPTPNLFSRANAEQEQVAVHAWPWPRSLSK